MHDKGVQLTIKLVEVVGSCVVLSKGRIREAGPLFILPAGSLSRWWVMREMRQIWFANGVSSCITTN